MRLSLSLTTLIFLIAFGFQKGHSIICSDETYIEYTTSEHDSTVINKYLILKIDTTAPFYNSIKGVLDTLSTIDNSANYVWMFGTVQDSISFTCIRDWSFSLINQKLKPDIHGVYCHKYANHKKWFVIMNYKDCKPDQSTDIESLFSPTGNHLNIDFVLYPPLPPGAFITYYDTVSSYQGIYRSNKLTTVEYIIDNRPILLKP
ncbi:MAG: hypothetical protein NC111_03925 [Bacteroides sp.]|nr:hypothetical protein [Bacteroides sp.]MCM1413916.1 hypothetical protein [Bacteroides sp.]MCM1471657.1 hypothetical protein [Bacteroides sp.]